MSLTIHEVLENAKINMDTAKRMCPTALPLLLACEQINNALLALDHADGNANENFDEHFFAEEKSND